MEDKGGEVGSLFSREGETGHSGSLPRSGEAEEVLRTGSMPKEWDNELLGR